MHKLNQFNSTPSPSPWPFLASLLLALLLIASLAAHATDEGPNQQLVVWNVGQGQWVTWEHDGICEHFDIGGELAPWKLIAEHCRSKKNRAHFSHWDWDHIGLAAKAARRFSDFCVVDFPRGPAPSKGKEAILSLPNCQDEAGGEKAFPTLFHSHQIYWKDSSPMEKLSSNDLSRVFEAGDAVIPGDSTKREEKLWARRATDFRPRVLVLGHHGSRTSSSELLLHALPSLTMAIASARKARYGHPHQEVCERLHEHHVALLKTEDWGTIRIELPSFHSEKRGRGSDPVANARTTTPAQNKKARSK